jgi:hypothetical protein
MATEPPTHTPGGHKIVDLAPVDLYSGKVCERDILWLADMKNLLFARWEGGIIYGIALNQAALSIVTMHLAWASEQFDFPLEGGK